MNKDNAKDYLPLVQALAEGKVIEVYDGHGWNEVSGPQFSLSPRAYRIKPEPKELWVNHYPNGVKGVNYESKLEAHVHRANDTAVQVCYREVIE